MRAQWAGALAGAAVALVAVAIAAAIYFYVARPAPEGGQATAAANTAASNTPPTTVQNMTLEAQFKGPLKDTVIQRWRDPDTNLTCYIYLPIVVQHSPPTPTGFVQYGANGIGSISCLRNP